MEQPNFQQDLYDFPQHELVNLHKDLNWIYEGPESSPLKHNYTRDTLNKRPLNSNYLSGISEDELLAMTINPKVKKFEYLNSERNTTKEPIVKFEYTEEERMYKSL